VRDSAGQAPDGLHLLGLVELLLQFLLLAGIARVQQQRRVPGELNAAA